MSSFWGVSYYDEVLNLLIEHFIDVGNSVAGKIYSSDLLLRFGEPLAIKAVHHIVSSQQLSKELTFKHSKVELEKKIDFSSAAVLTRTALETYLTFNYIFVSPTLVQEKEFRYYCWDLSGIIEREDYPATSEESIKKLNVEKREKKELIEKLEKNLFYRKISPEGRKRLKNGNWRIFKTWRDLAKESSMSVEYFNLIYSYLSSYCHSGRLSVMQIEQSKKLSTQKELMGTLIQFNIIILARLIRDYLIYLPECNYAHEKNEVAVFYTDLYYKIGNEFTF